MTRIKQSVAGLSLGLALTFTFGPAAAAVPVIPLYHANYSVSRNDFRVGNAQFSLIHNSNGSYTYQSVTKATGLAALFFGDVFTETSHFTATDGHLQPLLYSYVHSGGDNKKPETIRFDWSKGIAHSDDEGDQRTLPIQKGTYDRALAQLALSLDMAAGRLQETYKVLDHNKISTYRLRRIGEVRLKTPAGTYNTVEVARKDEKKNRTTSFWLAPKLDYLPVQMQQTEPGKATISLVLTEIHFDNKSLM